MKAIAGIGARTRRWGPWAIAGIVLVWAAACVFVLVDARSSALDGADRVEDLLRLSTSELLDGRAREVLAVSAQDIDDARDAASSPILAPLRLVPGAARHLRVLRDDLALADDLVTQAIPVVEAAATVGNADGHRERIDGLADLAAAVQALADRLPPAFDGDVGPLLGPLHDGHALLYERIEALAPVLRDASAVTTTLAELGRGPTTLLVFGANNAEMRAGHGAVLSWSVLSIIDGRIVTTQSEPIRTFPQPDDAATIIDPAVAPLWGWLNLANAANLGTSGRSDATLRALWDRYEAATGTTVDGAVLVDSSAISTLGERVGPLTIETPEGAKRLPPDEILDYLLHDQYRPIVDFEDLSGNDERREETAQLVSVIADRLFAPGTDLADVLDALRDIRDGRHLLVLTDDGEEAWRTLGVSATLAPSDLVVGVVNAGASKLDQYVDTAVRVDVADGGEVAVTVSAHNGAPVDDLPYVIGEQPVGTDPDAHAAMVSFTLPEGAQVIGEPDAPPGSVVVVDGAEGARPVVAVRLDIARGATHEVTIRFRVHPDVGMTALPTARIPPTDWFVDDEPVDVAGSRWIVPVG